MYNYRVISFSQSLAKFRAKALAVFVLLALSGNANALLISADDSDYGVGSITYDTDTGLEWLDPLLGFREGSGSFNDVQSALGAGGAFEGFRFARADELETLFFTSAGIDLSAPGGDDALGGLISLLGDTFSASFGYEYSFYATSAYYDLGTGGQIGLASLEAELYFGEWDSGDVTIGETADSPSQNANAFGSWLVRDTNDVVSVDEPGVLMLYFLVVSLFVGKYRLRLRRTLATG